MGFEDFSTATDVNDHGEIVGLYSTAGQYDLRAYLYRDGAFRDLGLANYVRINSRHEVALNTAIGNRAAVFIITDSSTNNIGGWDTFLYDLNNRGDVVGGAALTADSKSQAFLFRDGLMRSLGTAEEDWSYATALNDHGQVVGWSDKTSSDGSSEGYAFLYSDGRRRRLGDIVHNDGSWELGVPTRITKEGEMSGVGWRRNHWSPYLLVPNHGVKEPLR